MSKIKVIFRSKFHIQGPLWVEAPNQRSRPSTKIQNPDKNSENVQVPGLKSSPRSWTNVQDQSQTLVQFQGPGKINVQDPQLRSIMNVQVQGQGHTYSGIKVRVQVSGLRWYSGVDMRSRSKVQFQGPDLRYRSELRGPCPRSSSKVNLSNQDQVRSKVLDKFRSMVETWLPFLRYKAGSTSRWGPKIKSS